MFSHIVKKTSIHIVLSIVDTKYLHLEQLDVRKTSLHGDFDEKIYMAHPHGIEVKDNSVYRLKKNLYGLKQASRQWYMKFDNFMHEHG